MKTPKMRFCFNCGAEHTLERLIDHMRADIECMPGLPLNAAGYVADFYRKD
jgi:hypothetical protein